MIRNTFLFGEIDGGEMQLNQFGRIAWHIWQSATRPLPAN
jgi:hypothetical protein